MAKKDKKVKKTTTAKKKNKYPKLDETESIKMTEEDFQVLGDLESVDTAMATKETGEKKPRKAKKIAKKKKEKLDGITRFFNDYGDSPHLQAIEMSYLKYLEAQHAKESHLKAVKKMQILSALKTIQRYWKRKYQVIRNMCAHRIQRLARRYLTRLAQRNSRLAEIRASLLQLKLRACLLLFAKKRRVSKGYYRSSWMN